MDKLSYLLRHYECGDFAMNLREASYATISPNMV